MMNNSLVENEDYYFDKNGLLVLTAKYLSDKGECCGNGCRHCPYDYKNVPEPRKSILLNLNKSTDNAGK